jgi:acyl transferase domain-containing protein
MNDSKHTAIQPKLAVIGIGCYFPGINSPLDTPNHLFDFLLSGKNVFKSPLNHRWSNDDLRRLTIKNLPTGGYLDDISLFDAGFFNINDEEATAMDPQSRLFLETAIRALNHANIAPHTLANTNTGVFSAISTNEYAQSHYKNNVKVERHTGIGYSSSAVAGRLSHYLDLKGPSLSVDSACSSSLTAIDIAAKAITQHDCEVAIVGGVHLSICPDIIESYTAAGMLSKSGESNTFQQNRDGYVRSEGCGVVILKTADKALEDNDTIYGIIKGTHVCHDGFLKNIKSPSQQAQQQLHKSLYEKANIKAADIDFIETHGTGTIIGDKVEYEALKEIHQYEHSDENPLIIGAVKTQLGHTITASGMLGLIKVLLSFEHNLIPPNLINHKLSEAMNFKDIPAILPTSPTPFKKRGNKDRLAQVSSFGFTGTNASVIVAEPPVQVSHDAYKNDINQTHHLVISANSEKSIKTLIQSFINLLKHPQAPLSAVCFTSMHCRSHYDYRVIVSGNTENELIDKLTNEKLAIHHVASKNTINTPNNEMALHKAYLDGQQINATKLYPTPIKTAIPLYTFDRQSYWHQYRPETNSNDDLNTSEVLNKHHPYQMSWEPLAIHSQHTETVTFNRVICTNAEDLSIDGDFFSGRPLVVDLSNIKATEPDSHVLSKLNEFIKLIMNKRPNTKLVIVTKQAQVVLDSDIANLNASLVVGYIKTLALECPSLKPTLIDIDDNHIAHIDEIIETELSENNSDHEHLVAYRDKERYVYRIKKMSIKHALTSTDSQGSYLITGGLGGLGLVSAKLLLSQGAKKIVLSSRRYDDKARERIQILQQAFPDASIYVEPCDVSDKKQVAKLIKKCSSLGTLKGIIHAAGVGFKQDIINQKEADINDVFKGKVLGAQHLHDLTKALPLNFFVLYSSISSVTGANKESFYGACNEYLNQLALIRHNMGLEALAIQWPAWGESGMAVVRNSNEHLSNGLISDSDGQALLEYALGAKKSSICFLSPPFLQFMLDFMPSDKPKSYALLGDKPQTRKSFHQQSSFISELLKLSFEQRTEELCKAITNIIYKVLDISPKTFVNPEAGFFELGFDSLKLTDFASHLKMLFNEAVDIPFSIAFDYPTIEKLSQFLLNEIDSLSAQHIGITPSLDHDSHPDDDIAIIGYHFQFPKALTPENYYDMLVHGKDGFSPITRWNLSKYYDPEPGKLGKQYVKEIAFLDDFDHFDPLFFHIGVQECKYLDPIQRHFLRSSYLALEHANIAPSTLKGSATGVYAGISGTDYASYLLSLRILGKSETSTYASTGNNRSMIAGRVGYTFDLIGPCQTIDTACSSFSVAVHQASVALKNKEINAAIVGSVNLCIGPTSTISMCALKALSPDSRCFSFDERANGYARGEGTSVYILKRKQDAIRDGDTIHAIIKGSAVVSDGKSAGLTVPNGASQKLAMQKALDNCDLTPNDISYIEAHGTGTPLGDPIEVSAIQQVYSRAPRHAPIAIGSVKANIGNLEGTSGAASLAKIIMGLKHHKIFKQANLETLNPKLHLNQSIISKKTLEWSTTSDKRRAGINSFGYSGVNAHLIIEEADKQQLQPYSGQDSRTQVLCLSAKSMKSLDKLVNAYIQYLSNTTESYSDICLTSQLCRDHYHYRCAIIADSSSEALNILKNKDYETVEITTEQLAKDDYPNGISLQRAYLSGERINWRKLASAFKNQYKKCDLPLYRFDEKKYWVDIIKNKNSSSQTTEQLVQSKTVHAEDIKETILSIVSEILDIDDGSINLEQNLYDYGLNSLGLSEIESLIIQDVTRIPIGLNQEPFLTTLTIQDILNLTYSHIGSAAQKTPKTLDTFSFNDYKEKSPEQQMKQLLSVVDHTVKRVFELPDDIVISNERSIFSLGMDSLTAIEIRNHLNDYFSIAQLRIHVENFYDNPSIKAISEMLFTMLRDLNENYQATPIGHYFPMTYPQFTWWSYIKDGYLTNVCIRFNLKGYLDIEALNKACNELVKNNEMLRARFLRHIPLQKVAPYQPFEIDVLTIDGDSLECPTLKHRLACDQSYFLGYPGNPPIYFKLYKLNNQLHVINIIMTHLIADAETTMLIKKQLDENYKAYKRQDLPSKNDISNEYFHYVSQSNYSYEEDIDEKIEFWHDYAKDYQLLRLEEQHLEYFDDVAKSEIKAYQLSAEVFETCKNYFLKQNINATYGFSAILLKAISIISKQYKHTCAYLVTDRFNRHYSATMGAFLNQKMITVLCNKGSEINISELAKTIEQEMIYTAPYQDFPFLFKTINKLKFIPRLLSRLTERYSFKSFEDSYLHPTYANLFKKYRAITLWPNLKYKLFRKFKWPFLMRTINDKPNELMLRFNFTRSFFEGGGKASFADLDVIESSPIHGELAEYSSNALSLIFFSDADNKRSFTINGPVSQHFKTVLSQKVIELANEVTKENKVNVNEKNHIKASAA